MGKKSKKREYSSDSEQSSSEEERIKKHKKHKKKSKKKRKRSETDTDSSSEWVVKENVKKSPPKPRDDWMVAPDAFMLSTFTREKHEKKTVAKPNDEDPEVYDPVTSSRELNPYFKTGEGGLPSFQRPRDDDGPMEYKNSTSSSKHNWRRNKTEMSRRERSRSPSVEKSLPAPESESTPSHSDFLTDSQMNEIGAKMIKAEIMGNTKLHLKLKEKLDRAKEYKKKNSSAPAKDDKILLTLPTSSGMSRPIKESSSDRQRFDKKSKNKRVETHQDGERVRYFPDDGKYDIKQMFEREKYSDGRDQDIEFAKAISKVKDSEQMDMADIFSDTIRKDKQKKTDERDEAIREAQKMEKVLDSCNKCFDSPKMQKELVVHVFKHIYLAIPYYEGLVNHHLVISSIQHISCSLDLDEEVWAEFTALKKALTRFFLERKEDVIFFETVKYLHRRPHYEVHAISSKDFEMIQFYFKKAIQESEQKTINKKLVDIKNDKNIRSSIPRGLPYFWIDFGSNGMAHVIENQETFPSNFAQEIIGGMLNLDVNKWRKPRKEQRPEKRVQYFNSLLKNVLQDI